MKITPLLTQIRPTYFSVDCGMTYLIRLSDGRFVLIDSSYGEYDEPDKVYDLMLKQSVSDGIPTVAAWFFTHPHGDHINGFVNMLKKYGDRLRVEKVYYDFPAYEISSKACNMPSFLDAIERTGAETVTPKRGDKIMLADELFEVLYTASDFDTAFEDVNDASLVMKIHLGKYTFMMVGDLMPASSKILLSLYSPDELKCDIMQVAHHGYHGGSHELFSAIDPEIVLWPMPEFRYYEVSPFQCNRYFRQEGTRIRHIFVSGIEENTFDMTAPIEATVPYTPERITADFSSKSVRGLGWACITGGGMGNEPLDLSFTEEGCEIKTRTLRALLQLVQRGQVKVSDQYRLTMTMTPEKECETLGLIYDCPTPTTPDSYFPYSLPHKAGETLCVSLSVDRVAKTARIDVNGKTEVLPYRADDPCDLILILKDAKLRISEVIFENL